ncbi:MAG: MBL fold metallo-hydrolase [Bacillota bacterium]
MGAVDEILSLDNADLYRLRLDIPIPGYHDFITPYLIRESGFGLVMGTGLYRTMLVDPGPACGIPSLLKCLESLSVRRIDYVLLTHVHIDHAGGLGELIASYPGLKVVVHDRGRPHLLNPAKLWEGSLATLGHVAQAFGPISPVPESNLMPQDRGVDGLRVLDTPGHAPHHQSYLFRLGEKDVLFAGEAAGAYFFGDYLRPATPPRFFYDVTLASIDALAAAEASMACYGHYGVSSDVGRLLQDEKEQLALWRSVIGEVVSAGDQPGSGQSVGGQSGGADGEDLDELTDACLRRLLDRDPRLSEFRNLPPEVKEREAFYLRSSIKGFIGSMEVMG